MKDVIVLRGNGVKNFEFLKKYSVVSKTKRKF